MAAGRGKGKEVPGGGEIGAPGELEGEGNARGCWLQTGTRALTREGLGEYSNVAVLRDPTSMGRNTVLRLPSLRVPLESFPLGMSRCQTKGQLKILVTRSLFVKASGAHSRTSHLSRVRPRFQHDLGNQAPGPALELLTLVHKSNGRAGLPKITKAEAATTSGSDPALAVSLWLR